MKSYIKSLIFLSCILLGGSHVCGMKSNKMPEPAPGRTIIATFDIDEGNVNKDVRIINDRNANKNTRTGIESIYICKLGNNKEEQLEQMEPGNEIDGTVNKKYKFKGQGKYKIYYFFKEDLMITDMSYMFSNCPFLTSLDLSKFNTQKVEDMSYMFSWCFFLTSLNLSDFKTDSVVYMAGMFRGCSSLKDLNLSDFKTDSVVDMSVMFERCSSLKSLNLSNFNTDKVVNMSGMFYGCSSLKTLVLSNFNTEKVNKKDDLFYGCFNLKLVTTNDKHIKDCFEGKGGVQVINPNSCCCPCCKNR